ncbi:NAD-dependent epimerase/dehydratase family protein, partial [Patescibacteria group bacterium]
GKRWSETMATSYGRVYGIDVRIARLFKVYGPRMALFDGRMIPDSIADALDGKDLVIYGDGSFRTTLTYVTDAIDGMVRMMEAKEPTGIVNIGSDYDIRILDVIEKIIELTGSSSKLVYEEAIPFLHDPVLPNLEKAKALGWIPLVSLEQGLAKTIEYTTAHKGLVSPALGQDDDTPET